MDPLREKQSSLFYARVVRLRGAQLLAHSHTALRGRADCPTDWLELGSSPVSPRPSGCSGSGGVQGCVSLCPALGCLWQLPRKERRTPQASSPLPSAPTRPPPQLSNKQGGKMLRIQLEFISILILEPHFQQIIKLLFNYKQSLCVHSL